MPYTYYVRKIDLKRNVETETMKFIIPAFGEERTGFYRQVTSFNAFFKSLKRRNTHNGFLFYPQEEDRYLFEKKILKEEDGIATKDKDIVTYPNIWEFYKAIGYDYKKKKYIS